MDAIDILRELHGRIQPLVRDAVDGLDIDDLEHEPAPGANTIAWLIWHLTRVQDHHLAEVMGVEQIWVDDEWASRFGLRPDASNTGYGHTPDEASAVRPDETNDLLRYHRSVATRTAAYLHELDDADLDRIVDDSFDPPVTLGVRLASVADDSLQHVGQAAYVRGMLDL